MLRRLENQDLDYWQTDATVTTGCSERSFLYTGGKPLENLKLPISFGDIVRIIKTDTTDNLGLGGLTGTVLGFTIPSSSGIESVVGSFEDDYAVSVHIDSLGESRWFSTELVEFVSTSDVKSMNINGVRLMLDATGEWVASE